jgi:adiponectin receptor
MGRKALDIAEISPTSRRKSDLSEALKELGHRSLVNECFHFLYIEYGYRQTKTFKDTFYTLFSFHNETMNIWSHFIGFICVILAGINITVDIMASSDISYLELVAVEGFMICAAICLLLSTIYHWFGCMSEYCHNCLLKFDLTGVALLVSGSFFPAVYYGFYCIPHVQRIYFGVTVGILLVGLSAPWIEWTVFGHPVKPFVLASLVVFGLVPFVHWLLVTPTIFTDDLIWVRTFCL